MNQTMIAGHLGADPEVRFTSSGQKVTTLRVAAKCRRSGKGDETIWWRVSIWGDQFDKMISYFKKGSPIIVIGDLNKPEIFTDRDGKPQISMSLTAYNLSFSPFGKPDGQSGEAHHGDSNIGETPSKETYSSAQSSYGTVPGQGKTSTFIDDEVPF